MDRVLPKNLDTGGSGHASGFNTDLGRDCAIAEEAVFERLRRQNIALEMLARSFDFEEQNKPAPAEPK